MHSAINPGLRWFVSLLTIPACTICAHMFWFSPQASMQVKGMGGLSNGRQLVTVFQMYACAPLGAKEGRETQVLTWPLKASQKDMYPTETYGKWFTLLYFFQDKPAQMSFLVWRFWQCILFSISQCVFLCPLLSNLRQLKPAIECALIVYTLL